jgi:hypothetical protein
MIPGKFIVIRINSKPHFYGLENEIKTGCDWISKLLDIKGASKIRQMPSAIY